jgi:hypothetical protein
VANGKVEEHVGQQDAAEPVDREGRLDPNSARPCWQARCGPKSRSGRERRPVAAGRAARANRLISQRRPGKARRRASARASGMATITLSKVDKPGLHQREPGDAEQVGALVARCAATSRSNSRRETSTDRHGQGQPHRHRSGSRRPFSRRDVRGRSGSARTNATISGSWRRAIHRSRRRDFGHFFRREEEGPSPD